MKASDLRIGNFIERLKEDGTLGMTYVVRKIEDNIINSGIIKYTPIPIDEYWLLKFGFEFKDAMYYFEISPNTYLELDCDGLSYNLFIRQIDQDLEKHNHLILFSISVEFVHQLQNLVHSLTNKELTLKP